MNGMSGRKMMRKKKREIKGSERKREVRKCENKVGGDSDIKKGVARDKQDKKEVEVKNI